MTRFAKVLGVFLVSACGLWGCSRSPAESTNRVKQLEEEFRTASTARDQLRSKLTAAEESKSRLQQEVEKLKAMTKKQNELMVQTKQERDDVQAQYDSFRKNLKDLLGQAEATLNKTGEPPVGGSALALPVIAGAGVTPMLIGCETTD
jgi:septal ring factor EnvC (AmiA/AmiB activator)